MLVRRFGNWIVGVWNKFVNNLLYFFEKNYNNINFFYLFLITSSWLIMNYKLSKLQIDILNGGEIIDSLQQKIKDTTQYTNDILKINNFINNKGIIVSFKKNEILKADEFFLDLDNFKKNNIYDINELSKEIDSIKKNIKIKKIFLLELSWDDWKTFKINYCNNILNVSEIDRKKLNSVEEMLKENKITFESLKNKRIYLVCCLGLLASLNILYKNILI